MRTARLILSRLVVVVVVVVVVVKAAAFETLFLVKHLNIPSY